MGEIIGTDSVIITGIGFPMSTDSTEVYNSDSPQPVNALDAAVEAVVQSRVLHGDRVSRPNIRRDLQAALDVGEIHVYPYPRGLILGLESVRDHAVATVVTALARVAGLEQEVSRLVGVLTEAQHWDAKSAAHHGHIGVREFIEQALGEVRP